MKKSFFKRFCSMVCAGVLATAMTVSAASFCKVEHVNAAEEVLTGLSAMEITGMMGKGFNIGNTLDATGGSMDNIEGHETSWGNPVINADLMHGIKEAGFTTVRIPITWMKHIDKNNGYAISEDFMNRVKEVVDMAYGEELFVIINVHHESWVNRSDIDTAYEEIGEELAAVWAQISEAFADYDQHLIFEGMNEPRASGTDYEWTGTSACYDAVQYLDNIFVQTVRSNGNGYNDERMLMIPGYAASSDPNTFMKVQIPEVNGVQATNVAISVHCYNPYVFCLTDDQTTFDPSNGSDTSGITNPLKNLKSTFLDNGIAVVIGECGCTNSGNNNDARLAWFSYFGNITAEYGIPAIVWDNGAGGSSGGECHKYLNRKTGEAVSQDLIDAFICKPLPPADAFIDFESIVQGDSTVMVNPTDVGFTSSQLNTRFRVNHTPDVKMGFSLEVGDTVDYEALLSIGKYAGIPIGVTAWISSKSDSHVTVGTTNANDTELASIDTTEDWVKVSFVITPGEGDCLYFRGSDVIFYIDDIQITMNPDESAFSDGENATEDETISEADGEIVADGNVENTDSATAAEESENASHSRAWIVIPVLAVAAVIIAIAVVRKRKK